MNITIRLKECNPDLMASFIRLTAVANSYGLMKQCNKNTLTFTSSLPQYDFVLGLQKSEYECVESYSVN